MNMKPVICPYCGTQMIAHDNGQGRYWYYCQKCAAYSPYGFSAQEAFEHAQRRYEPLVNPLTWDELVLRKGDVVYLEDFGVAEILVALLPEITPEYACFRDSMRFFYAEKEDMNIRWRAWPCKPSMEVRTMVEWSSESRDT